MMQKVRYKKLEHFGYGPNVMKKYKVCAVCGRMNKAFARVCLQCGGKLSSETLFDRYKRHHLCCPDCDSVLSVDSLYCPNCGKKIISYQEKTL